MLPLFFAFLKKPRNRFYSAHFSMPLLLHSNLNVKSYRLPLQQNIYLVLHHF
tara:strand:- start:1708 stop:1863 length:156 start_codon:yes stop_codon:yes gene_type:complete